MDFLQLDVAQQGAVRDAIVSEWRRRQSGRYLMRPGGWHACRGGHCRMVQLACDVRLQDGLVNIVARGTGHVRVRNLFVCWQTGKVHTCTDACNRCEDGACHITGHRFQAATLPLVTGGDTSLSRRLSATVHRRGAVVGTNVVRRTTRDIMQYLCFSDTRRRYACRLLESARGKTRRWVARRLREGHAVHYRDVHDFYGSTVFTARACTLSLRMDTAARNRLLRATAECVHRLHVALGPEVVSILSSVRVFSLAAMYLMRTGLRSSQTGQMVVPRVTQLAIVLPNAHLLSSITFPDIREAQSRSRQLTNSIRFLGAAVLKLGTTPSLHSCWVEDGGGG